MKFVQEHCSICKKEQAMPVVQEDEKHPGLIWVQCPGCREIKPVETAESAELEIKEREAPEPGDSGVENGQIQARRVVRHYRAGERFNTGEWIYHPEWKDTGQVIERSRSTGGHEIIVVSFEKVGTKRLVSNFAN